MNNYFYDLPTEMQELIYFQRENKLKKELNDLIKYFRSVCYDEEKEELDPLFDYFNY